ncbi:sigma-70 family RNA polymerase sigma factor [Paenibacillus eucommiae]|uniref:RNA polymerase sigma-B factor n=1 Tax=Paenibacillus eucommiae TaxID=1355755 RepID=A0ABS4IN88_9BACL|nr:sigma-70 family RNA polymerase sigma factor [Paenibacillus eucommiae]MBP1988970.1 RNA polymerase sigma-B factor [Paenibacillus eucommiae]
MSINSEPREVPSVYELIMEYQQTECNEIATTLLVKYEPMVKMAAGKISRSRPDLYEDLVQVGHMSLLRLFKQYDVTLGVQFEPYMMKSIIGHMKNFLRDKSWYIQVPRRIKEKGFQLQNAIDNLTARLERSPKVEEIAEEVGLTEEETIEILAGRECYHYVSLDTPLSEEENGATIGDILATSLDEYRKVDSKLDLQEALTIIKDDERKVLELAYVQGHSQRAIADELNVSQMSVSRMQRRALDKLRSYFAEKGQSPDF